MRSVTALFLVGILFAVMLAPATSVLGDSAEPEPAFGPVNFFGSASPPGWGFSSGSGISNPGPTITVTQFETVTLDLFSDDGSPHTWFLDLDRDGSPDPGENESAGFPPDPRRFSFVVTAPPSPPATPYHYACGVHGSFMRGDFVVLPGGNAPPTVALTNPDGVAQNSWTGGSSQRLTWTMSDPDGLPSQLAAWLNYTSSAGSGPIGVPPVGQTSFDWTLPSIDATNVLVVVEVADPGGATASDANLVPIIDSTAPSVSSTVPADNAVGVDPSAPVAITLSEAMNPLGPGAVSLSPPAGALTLSWNPGNTVLTVDHAPLQRATRYDVTVSDFVDASDPGNALEAYDRREGRGSRGGIVHPHGELARKVLGVCRRPLDFVGARTRPA